MVQKEGRVIFKIDKPNIQKYIAEKPDVFEEVWQTGKYLIGVGCDIKDVTAAQLEQLVELAWRNKAPKKLIKKFEEQ